MDLELISTGLFFVGATFVLTFGAYFLTRWCLVPRSDEQARELASSVIFRVAALHGLILALVFAEELDNSNALVEAVNREANQIESIYFDLARHGGDESETIRHAIAYYVRDVIENEWHLLDNHGTLSDDAWRYREIALGGLLDLDEITPRQKFLRQRMLDQMAAVETERNNREIIAVTDVSTLFWVIAFVGIALVAAPYFPFKPNTANLSLLGVYAGYTGLVLFFIYAFDNPFSGFSGVRPVSLELLYDEFLAKVVAASPSPPG
jgi:hypothetical protein